MPRARRALADLLGVSVPYISDVELGRRRFTPERLEVVAAFLDDAGHGSLLEELLDLGGICRCCHGSGKAAPIP